MEGKSPWKHDRVLRTLVKKMSVTPEHLVLHRNGSNSNVISSFISDISYIPLVLGLLLSQGDQDLQVRPNTYGWEEK